MRIEEILKSKDIEIYRELKKIGRKKRRRKNKIELGDKVENLMKHDAYKRVRGALRQIRWG